MNLVIPFAGSRLRPETREFGELVGARFIDVGYESPGLGNPAAVGKAGAGWGLKVTELPGGPKTTTDTTGYWDLLNLLWSGDDDFLVVEHDVLPTEECVRSMWACTEEWCSGTHGRWAWERSKAGAVVLRNDSYLECAKFGSIRRRVPDLMARVGMYQPNHQWIGLETLVLSVLQDEEGLSPHVHFPRTRHLRETEVTYPNPWDSLEDGPNAPQ